MKKATSNPEKGYRGVQAKKALKLISSICEWCIDQEWLENSEHIHDLVQQNDTTAWVVERDAAYTQNTQLWVSHDAGASWQQTTLVPA